MNNSLSLINAIMISFYAPLGSAECPVNNDCVSPFCKHKKKSGAEIPSILSVSLRLLVVMIGEIAPLRMYIIIATNIALLIHTKKSVSQPCPILPCELSKFTLIGKAKIRFLQYVRTPLGECRGKDTHFSGKTL